MDHTRAIPPSELYRNSPCPVVDAVRIDGGSHNRNLVYA
jgi:hypothetical protein